ncbi:MAG: beta-lactamase family protein [Micrococcales bacterium]|nr:beta-lactamase family protein [Micrococcales bacterium]
MSSTPALQDWLDGALRSRLDRLTRRRSPGLPAPQVLVEAPGVRFGYGAVEQPFHTASIGKVFVAVLIGRLVEQGRLALDSPVGTLMPADDLAGLPAADGVDLGVEVTVEHLLAHRSGLPDPLEPPRGHRTACSLAGLGSDPDRRWDLRSVLAQARGLPAVGRPGARFGYTDAGFALLLRVAEEVAGRPARELLREQVFDPAGMTHTGQPHDTATRAELAALDIAPMWVARAEVSRLPVLSVGSVDGGAVTTADDLVRFQRALHAGALISAELLAHLARPRSRLRPGIHYGAGLATLRFGEFMPLVLRGLPEPVGGLGLTAAHAFHYPAQDAQVVLNLHSTRAMRASFQLHIQIARRLAALPG